MLGDRQLCDQWRLLEIGQEAVPRAVQAARALLEPASKGGMRTDWYRIGFTRSGTAAALPVCSKKQIAANDREPMLTDLGTEWARRCS